MEREHALEIRDLARTIASNITHEEAEAILRTYVIRRVELAIAALTTADALDDPIGTRALGILRGLCYSCHRDVRAGGEHAPSCPVGEDGAAGEPER
jgi:hypothetical protein